MKLFQNGIKTLNIILVFVLIVASVQTIRAAVSDSSYANTNKKVDEHGTCAVVVNEGSHDYFVPTNSANEWGRFRDAVGCLNYTFLGDCSKYGPDVYGDSEVRCLESVPEDTCDGDMKHSYTCRDGIYGGCRDVERYGLELTFGCDEFDVIERNVTCKMEQ